MLIKGTLQKMITEWQTPIQYYLDLGSHIVHLNQYIGKNISIKHTYFECLCCHQDKPIFAQGFCKSCYFKTPHTGDWVMNPELSKAHLEQEDRDLDFEKKMQLQPHVVYLANSSNLKVGVTRVSQIPTRWIDQGAEQAIPIVLTPNRYLAGITEVALKNHAADKTNWRRMLATKAPEVDLIAQKELLTQYVPQEAQNYIITENKLYDMVFPIEHYPVKINSINLSKTPEFTKKLIGIKGQYLIFEDGNVINIRSHEGFGVELSI